MNKILLYIILLSAGLQAQKSFESFDRTKIAFSDTGSGIPVILIHGFISSGDSWKHSVLAKDLAENGYRVIIPDLRGNGQSDRPQEAVFYANDAEIKDLIALADFLKLESYLAVGYSRGAIVLSKLLIDEPRIKKAVLGGMGLDFTNPDWSRRIMFQKAFSGEEPPNDITEGAIKYAKSIGADSKILGYLQEYQPVTSIKELQTIKANVLVIAGDQDKDNGDPKKLSEQIPGAFYKIVPGTHNDTKNTAAFSNEVISFLMK
ncbi:alpha/beta fold hydrolase [Lutimonas halocynthiae]|uniref:alpha/beta fold hydrolase n=1 Tax=Lutimonas halocynthiae TaxID=1446477 RepID=UPI0025B40BB2|nr:alpha/beta fold hydrolase [Lutimonas halocynthiae]MDN3644061.1 alpha/beta fold hydrolase [Lutimonas halocynthiae]